MNKSWFRIGLALVLFFGIAAVVFMVLVLRFLSESGTTRFLLVNDTDNPITYSVLHDDGDNSRNKTLRKLETIKSQDQSEIKIYGSVHCIFIYKNNEPIASFSPMAENADTQSTTSSVARYMLSKQRQPCPFKSEFPFDN